MFAIVPSGIHRSRIPLEQHKWVDDSCDRICLHQSSDASRHHRPRRLKSTLNFHRQPRLPRLLQTGWPPPAKDETTATMPRVPAPSFLLKVGRSQGVGAICELQHVSHPSPKDLAISRFTTPSDMHWSYLGRNLLKAHRLRWRRWGTSIHTRSTAEGSCRHHHATQALPGDTPGGGEMRGHR
jgi:hypothetical protein